MLPFRWEKRVIDILARVEKQYTYNYKYLNNIQYTYIYKYVQYTIYIQFKEFVQYTNILTNVSLEVISVRVGEMVIFL